MRHCIALQRLITLLSLSLLLHCIFVSKSFVPSSSPHIKVILPPNSTTPWRSRYFVFIHFRKGGYLFPKQKVFYYYAVITYICVSILVSISYYTLPYLVNVFYWCEA